MSAPPFGVPGWHPPPPEPYYGQYNSYVFPPPPQHGPLPGTRRFSDAVPFDGPMSAHYPDYWPMAGGAPPPYMMPPYAAPHWPPGYPSPATSFSPPYSPKDTHGVYSAHNHHLRTRSEHRGYSPLHPGIAPYQQDQHINTLDHVDKSVFDYESSSGSTIPPYRRPTFRNEPQHIRTARRTSGVHEYGSDSEDSLDKASDRTIGQTSPLKDRPHCELCEKDGHGTDSCYLAQWDEPTPQVTARDSGKEQFKLDEDQEKYQKLAGKLSHICWNLIPDSEQPPESHKTMMKHILGVLSGHPDNPEVVYDHLFGRQFDHKWLCLKAMCDTEWQGPVWLVDGACRYCKNPSRPGPVTLCYQIMPNRGRMAIYREVGTVRA